MDSANRGNRMRGTLRLLAMLGLILSLAGCASAPRVVASGGSSSGDGKVAAGVDIAKF